MAGKIQLKLKKKEPEAPAAAPAAAPAGAAGGAPAFAMPTGGASGITLELRGATVHIAEVVIKRK